MKEPQWALVTVYLLSQPMVGAILSKSAYRLVGTACGAVFALVCLGLFAQSGPLFILGMALWLACCTIGATLSRNFASYGFGLAAYSALMIGFGSVDAPDEAWRMAGDRVTEVGLGIICAALVHIVFFPRYAHDVLDGSIRTTFSSLARYAAIVLRPDTPGACLPRHAPADVGRHREVRRAALLRGVRGAGAASRMTRRCRARCGRSWACSVARGLFIRLIELRAPRGPGGDGEARTRARPGGRPARRRSPRGRRPAFACRGERAWRGHARHWPMHGPGWRPWRPPRPSNR